MRITTAPFRNLINIILQSETSSILYTAAELSLNIKRLTVSAWKTQLTTFLKQLNWLQTCWGLENLYYKF